MRRGSPTTEKEENYAQRALLPMKKEDNYAQRLSYLWENSNVAQRTSLGTLQVG